MEIKKFKIRFYAERDLVDLGDDLYLVRKPFALYCGISDKSVKFKSFEEALDYKTRTGKTIRQYIQELKTLDLHFDGGRGSSSGNNSWSGGFNHANDNYRSKDSAARLFPVHANSKIKTKSFESALAQFRADHGSADREYGYSVDSSGFVNNYVRGAAHSVAIGASKRGDMVIHNHPGGGAFSDSDLLSTAYDRRAKGVIATSNAGGTYTFVKGGHFRAEKFISAVKNAKLSGRDYNDAARKWLTRNQKKYGYKFTFEK